MQRSLTLSFSAQCRRVVEIFNPLVHGNATVVMLVLKRAQAYSDTSALACGGCCTCVEVAEEEFC